MGFTDKLLKPVSGLSTDLTHGGQLQNSGSENQEFKILFAALDVENAKTVRVGNIDISNCTQICLPIVFVKGGLTSASLLIEFNDTRGTFDYPLSFISVWDTSDNVITLKANPELKFTSDFIGYFSFPNPGFPRLKLSTKSDGLIESSTLLVSLLRGWGNSHMAHQAVIA